MGDEEDGISVAAKDEERLPAGWLKNLFSIAFSVIGLPKIWGSTHHGRPPSLEPPVPPPPQGENIESHQVLPLSSTSSPGATPQENHSVHPVIVMMQELELGKFIINLAIPTAILISINEDKFWKPAVSFITAGLSFGSIVVWNGMLFRKTFPTAANIAEQFGSSIVLFSFIASIMSSQFIPPVFKWILGLVCGCLYNLPFITAALHH